MIERWMKVFGYRPLLGITLLAELSTPSLKAQAVASGYTQSSFVKTLCIQPPSQAVTFSVWVDQTDFLSMTISSLVNDLSIRLVGPSGVVFTFGQPVIDQFQCYVTPDPQQFPYVVGANYHMDLANPILGQWAIQIQSPTALASPISLPARITFSNQVGPVINGGRNGPVGKPVPFSLAVIDGAGKVNSFQINATLHRLDDPTIIPVQVVFADDGEGVDYASGDAIYSAFLVPDQPGDFMLQIEVSGDASTGHFQRSIASGFKIVPKSASITGNFTVKPRVGVPK